jgi:hypothetical protein
LPLDPSHYLTLRVQEHCKSRRETLLHRCEFCPPLGSVRTRVFPDASLLFTSIPIRRPDKIPGSHVSSLSHAERIWWRCSELQKTYRLRCNMQRSFTCFTSLRLNPRTGTSYQPLYSLVLGRLCVVAAVQRPGIADPILLR